MSNFTHQTGKGTEMSTPETTPEKGEGEKAIDAITALAESLADRSYFSRPLEVMNADRRIIAKFIEISDVIRKAHDDIFDAEVLKGNENVAQYKRFRKKQEPKSDPLKNLFK
jgi:hypothetical protein